VVWPIGVLNPDHWMALAILATLSDDLPFGLWEPQAVIKPSPANTIVRFTYSHLGIETRVTDRDTLNLRARLAR
jgi:hypothetical protein